MASSHSQTFLPRLTLFVPAEMAPVVACMLKWRKSTAISFAVWYRSSGSLARHLRIMSSAFARQLSVDGARRRSRTIQNFVNQRAVQRRTVRALTRGNLIQHDPQCIDVGTRIEIFAAQLFRRHIGQCAGDGVGFG